VRAEVVPHHLVPQGVGPRAAPGAEWASAKGAAQES